jgi:hypothetical protein
MNELLDPTIDARIRALVRESGMPLRLFSHAVGERTEDALNWWANGSWQLTSKNVGSLAQYLGISEHHLLSADRHLPISLIRDRLFTGPAVLPEIYARQASSFVRSSAHIIEYLSLAYGRHFVDRILLNMDVHPHVFADLDNKINLLFFMNLLNEVQRAGLSEAQVDSLACYVFLRIQETDLGREFAKAETYQDCYSVLDKNKTMFDSNFEYKFEIDRHQVRLYAKPTEAELFLKENEPSTYERLFRYKRKLVGWFPTLSNLAPVKMNTPRCVSYGDAYTLYQLDIGESRGFKPSYLKILGGLD